MMFSKKWQQTLKKWGKNRYFQKIVVLSLGIVLMWIYGSQITLINTVWELGDEAGYLCNAAYFSNSDWSDVASCLPYYGYGYSVVLTPLFYICKSGISLIHGAILINTICVLLSYFIQISVMKVICNKCNQIMLAVFAFIVSLQPYLASNVLKVLCEVFLTMWVWIIAYALIQAFKYRSIFNFILLGVATGYIFFIHTRAIVVVGTVGLILLAYFVMKKISFKEILLFGVTLLIIFIILYAVKRNIIIESMKILEGDARNDVNMINANYVFRRLIWLFSDFHLYIISFCGKMLYLISTTGGMILFGISGWMKGVKESYICKEDDKLIVYLYLGCTFILMLIICTLNGAGTTDNFTYIFYSRYYEFTVSSILFLGLYEAVYNTKKNKTYIAYVIITLISGIITLTAQNALLESDKIHIDTARIPGFTYIISQNKTFSQFIAYATLYSVLVIVIIVATKKKKMFSAFIPILITIIMISNSRECIECVLNASRAAYGDVEVATFILENEREDKIIFADSDFKWSYYYSRMQVLIKEKKLEVIQEEETELIEPGTYFLTYLSSPLGQQLEKEGKLVKRGSVFGVYCY